MTNLTRKVITGLATGALVSSLFAQVAFADAGSTSGTNLTIQDNGQNSNNSVQVTNTSSTQVQQSNTAKVTNNVTTTENTGGNKANDNVGQGSTGGVSIHTGDTSASTTVANALNSNSAEVNSCGCQSGSTNVDISGNGKNSTNNANLTQGNTVVVGQANSADVTNNVKTNQNTGDNHSNDNVGGAVSIHTGAASQDTKVQTFANSNQLMVGGGNGSAGGSGTNLTIGGNVEHSHNAITLSNTSLTEASQANEAYVKNNVTGSQNTGKNGADDNIGSVSIHTGNVDGSTEVDNAINFNAADLANCGCATGVNADVSGNGRNSYNKINATLGDILGVGQGNDQDLTNNVGGGKGANTGNNYSNDNGGSNVDPAISTGDVTSQDTSVSNTGGVNTYGPSTFTLPGNTELSFSFDWNNFWNNWMM